MKTKYAIFFGAAILALTASSLGAQSPSAAQNHGTGVQPPANSIFQVLNTPNFFKPPRNNDLAAIAASSPTDIWAVGQSTIHFDGVAWTAFAAPMIGGNNTSGFNGVVDFSPTNAWAVGEVGSGLAHPGQVIERWDGTAWTVAQGPRFAKGDQPSLTCLTATSPTDIWAAGFILFDDGQQLAPLFEHYDGTSWTATMGADGAGFIFGCSADAQNDAWAVGFSGLENDDSRTLAEHWDGTTWKIVSSPSVGNGANQLNGVLALAPNDAWAVGFSTSVAPPQQAATLTLTEHWDGTKWSVVPSPNVGPNSKYQSNRLFGVTALSSTDVWAGGSYFAATGSGHQMTLGMRWNGAKWQIAPTPNPTSGNFLSDLIFAGVSIAPGNVWLAGAEDANGGEATMVLMTTGG